MKIDMKKYNKIRLQEAANNLNTDLVVAQYLNEKKVSLNYNDYKNEGSDKVTLKQSRFGSNEFANQSWIIQIAGLGIEPDTLGNVIPNKVIIPISETEGEIKTLSIVDCKNICDSLYTSTREHMDISPYIENGRYRLNDDADPLLRSVAGCYLGGNGKESALNIQTPMGEIDGPEAWQDFVYAYLKEWYDTTPFSSRGKYKSSHPLIVDMALFYATKGDYHSGLGTEDTSTKYESQPYTFMLNRLGYYLSGSRDFSTKYGNVETSKDNKRTDNLESLGYYLGQKFINNPKNKRSISLNDTSKGKDGGDMSNEERVGGVIDSGIQNVEVEEELHSNADIINSKAFQDRFWTPIAIKNTTFKSKSGGTSRNWRKIDCNKEFHWKDMFALEDFTNDVSTKIAAFMKKDVNAVKQKLFGNESCIFNVVDEESLKFNNDNLLKLKESTKFSKYERLLGDLELLLEAKDVNIKKDGDELIKAFSKLNLDFDKDGNLISSTGKVLVQSNEKMEGFFKKYGDINIDSSLFKIILSSTARSIAEAIRAFGLVRFYSFFLASGRIETIRTMRGGANINSTPDYYITALPFILAMEDEFTNNRYTINLNGIVKKVNSLELSNSRLFEGEDISNMKDKIKSISEKIFNEGVYKTTGDGDIVLNISIVRYIEFYVHYKDILLTPSDGDEATELVDKMFKKIEGTTSDWMNYLNSSSKQSERDKGLLGASKDTSVMDILLKTIKSYAFDDTTKESKFKNFEYCGQINGRPVTADTHYYQYCKDFPVHLLIKAIAMGKVKITDSSINLKSGLMSTGCFPCMVNTSRERQGVITLNSLNSSLLYINNTDKNSSLGNVTKNQGFEYNKFFRNAFKNESNLSEFIKKVKPIVQNGRAEEMLQPFVRGFDQRLISEGVDINLVEFNDEFGSTPLNTYFYESKVLADEELSRMFEDIYEKSN